MTSTINNEIKNTIIEWFKTHHEEVIKIRNEIADKDITIFFGNTKSGKSTIINYLIGNELEAFEKDKDYKIEKRNPGSVGPDIGQTSVSETSNPGIYKDQGNGNEYLMDLPGFEDNRSVLQNIINAFSISQVKFAKTVKFVVVFGISEITSDNISLFTKTLEYVADLIRNIDELKHHFCFVFTKDCKKYTQDEIMQLLKNKVLNVELNCNKTLVSNIVASEKFIGLFRMPTEGGVVTNNIDVNVKGAIKYTHRIDVEKCKIEVTIPDPAKKVLLEIYPEYTESSYFDSEIARLTQNLNNYFEIDRYVYASYDDKLVTTVATLTNIQMFIQAEIDKTPTTLFCVEKSLKTIFLNMVEETVSHAFLADFNFVVAMDKSNMMEEKYRSKILENYKNSLQHELKRITNLVKKIKEEQASRKTSKIIFNTSIGGLALGSVPLVGTAFTVVNRLATTGGVVQKLTSRGAAAYAAVEGALGTAGALAVGIGGAVAFGAGAGGLYVTYKELYTKRNEARKLQGRD